MGPIYDRLIDIGILCAIPGTVRRHLIEPLLQHPTPYPDWMMLLYPANYLGDHFKLLVLDHGAFDIQYRSDRPWYQSESTLSLVLGLDVCLYMWCTFSYKYGRCPETGNDVTSDYSVLVDTCIECPHCERVHSWNEVGHQACYVLCISAGSQLDFWRLGIMDRCAYTELMYRGINTLNTDAWLGSFDAHRTALIQNQVQYIRQRKAHNETGSPANSAFNVMGMGEKLLSVL